MGDRTMGRGSRSHGAGRTTSRSRRPEGRRGIARVGEVARTLLAARSTIPLTVTTLLFVAALVLVVATARRHPVLPSDRIMDRTQLVRSEFSVPDEEATRSKQNLARARAARVYNADQAMFESLTNSLRTLPTVLASAETFEAVNEEVRKNFRLTAEQFEALRAEAAPGQSPGLWESRVDAFMRSLRELPMLSNAEFQQAIQSDADDLELTAWDGTRVIADKDDALNIETDDEASMRAVITELTRRANSAGLFGPRAAAAVQRVLVERKPTYILDRKATDQRLANAVAGVAPVMISFRAGDVLFQRGGVLTDKARSLALLEHSANRRSMSPAARAQEWGGVVGIVLLATAALGGYVGLYYRATIQSPGRLAIMTLLVAGAVALAAWFAVINPEMLLPAAIGPPLLVCMISVIAFDRRLALALAGVMGILVAAALHLSIGSFIVLMTGVGVASWQLADIRRRQDVVRATVVLAITLMVAVLFVSFLERPRVPGIWQEMIGDAAKAGFTGFAAGAVMLLILPGVERVFDVTTGMKLSELRDPKQPLLRLLQQRAPGTYNHSLNVASIAEAAAESIGANGLHLYVGALYHDVGKMNKPDYFVENQSGGISRHARLSPAMSLLVIVGHVKDGVELAREYGLPRALIHYIESHHGTTLVEYFYDQARKQADAEGSDDLPDEVEYRYPGPRPRTKEAAILMLSDAVESATRTLHEPTPSRIASLVHTMATKRLMDGQFDESNMTLRELATVEEAITRTLCSIYHGRIAYPREATEPAKRAEQTA